MRAQLRRFKNSHLHTSVPGVFILQILGSAVDAHSAQFVFCSAVHANHARERERERERESLIRNNVHMHIDLFCNSAVDANSVP